jgi:hypothetical protein
MDRKEEELLKLNRKQKMAREKIGMKISIRMKTGN